MIPTEIRANFDFAFNVPGKASFVPSGLTPKFILAGAASVVKSGVISGDDILFTFAALDTASLATGHYWWQVIAEDSTNRVFILDGTVMVSGAVSGSGAFDGRTIAQKIVDAIDAVIQNKATADQQSYVIQSGTGSRSLVRCSPEELLRLRQYYASIVSSERRASKGESLFKKHQFGFVNA